MRLPDLGSRLCASRVMEQRRRCANGAFSVPLEFHEVLPVSASSRSLGQARLKSTLSFGCGDRPLSEICSSMQQDGLDQGAQVDRIFIGAKL